MRPRWPASTSRRCSAAAIRARNSGNHAAATRPKSRLARFSASTRVTFSSRCPGAAQGLLSTTNFPKGVPQVGDPVEFHIERYDPANGLFILTREGQAVAADWSTVQIGQTVEARVTDVNKGGLSVDVNGIRGFLPISQIDLYRVEQPEQFVNQKLLCMVAEVNPEERNLVVSRRALLERDRLEKQEQIWANLKEGQIHKGVVRSVKPFGAFVDIGGVDGLVPVGEMAWKRIKDPAEIVQLGQAVEVVVIRLDRETPEVDPKPARPDDQPVGAGIRQLPTTLARQGHRHADGAVRGVR